MSDSLLNQIVEAYGDGREREIIKWEIKQIFSEHKKKEDIKSRFTVGSYCKLKNINNNNVYEVVEINGDTIKIKSVKDDYADTCYMEALLPIDNLEKELKRLIVQMEEDAAHYATQLAKSNSRKEKIESLLESLTSR